ncbi:myosin-9-like isoform X2 [Artemia franciscana]
MDSSIRNQPTADGTSINLEILASEKGLETAAECVSSTNETVRVNVFPAHLRETSFGIWLHSSTKEITDPISNGIVSSGGTVAPLFDGQIPSFVDIELKKADVDDLLTEHHKSKELFEERSLASERPSSPSSSKSFEVLAWVVNQEQSSNEHQLKRLDSLDIEMDGHGAGRIMNKSNSQENCFHSSDSFPASEISYMDNAVQFDSENDVRCAQGQEFEMVNGCNSTCNENLRKQSASTSCLTQPLLKSILDAMETKLEAFHRIIKAEFADSPPKWFLEYMEAQEKLKENFESHAEQQATKICLQNALTELETTRAEMVKVQKESVRNTAMDWTAITSLRNELNRVQNELALESSKHAEEISTFEKENAATAHALEQIQTEARLLKSSLESSLSKNEGALVQLGKSKGQLEEALDRESSLKLQLKELQDQLSAIVTKKDEDSYKHTEEISSLEEKNSATVHALEQAQTEASQLKSSLESSLIQLEKTEG